MSDVIRTVGEQPAKPFIRVNNVWQEYGDQVVLERLNLSVNEGEFCTLVGASGCGKSTFLRLLLGQERPSRGEILLDDAPIAGEPDVSRGVVFQRYSVFPHLSVLDNVALGLELPRAPLLGRLFGRSKREAREQAEVILRKVGLGHSLDKYPAQLSGGMQQRLAIAQALVMEPRVLLLDEPFGALDPGIRKDMHELLLQLWRETQLTVFMVTHDLSEGFTLPAGGLDFRDVPQQHHQRSILATNVLLQCRVPIDQLDIRDSHGNDQQHRCTDGNAPDQRVEYEERHGVDESRHYVHEPGQKPRAEMSGNDLVRGEPGNEIACRPLIEETHRQHQQVLTHSNSLHHEHPERP